MIPKDLGINGYLIPKTHFKTISVVNSTNIIIGLWEWHIWNQSRRSLILNNNNETLKNALKIGSKLCIKHGIKTCCSLERMQRECLLSEQSIRGVLLALLWCFLLAGTWEGLLMFWSVLILWLWSGLFSLHCLSLRVD